MMSLVASMGGQENYLMTCFGVMLWQCRLTREDESDESSVCFLLLIYANINFCRRNESMGMKYL